MRIIMQGKTPNYAKIMQVLSGVSIFLGSEEFRVSDDLPRPRVYQTMLSL